MHRKSLLVGLLSGLILGVSAMLAIQIIGHSASPSRREPISSVSSPLPLAGKVRVYPADSLRLENPDGHHGPLLVEPFPLIDKPLRSRSYWYRGYINGIPYYIVPLTSADKQCRLLK